ncbi:basic proline-rich protein-like [Eubalaena glacialis]|uniref:basic proline-rich protein-like n=1 Tax=Eubalaena glacialis TaxID=27606 RepID=UPI002A5B062A|nr:basic proline-rich protein-like [Eubalaena glacialis]
MGLNLLPSFLSRLEKQECRSLGAGNQDLHHGNPNSRAGGGGPPSSRWLQPGVSSRFQASSGDSGLPDPLPGARRPPSPASRGRPQPRRPRLQPAGPSPGNSRQPRGPWEAYPGRGSFPIPSRCLGSPSESAAGEGGRSVPVGGSLTSSPSPPGGAVLGLFSPAPPNASWLLLLSPGAWPLPPAYSIASHTRAASKAGTGGGKGEGRGGTGEEE